MVTIGISGGPVFEGRMKYQAFFDKNLWHKKTNKTEKSATRLHKMCKARAECGGCEFFYFDEDLSICRINRPENWTI